MAGEDDGAGAGDGETLRELEGLALSAELTIATGVTGGAPTFAVERRRGEWRRHWRAASQPWRTEPEVDAERQAMLAERRAIAPDIRRGIYPFKDLRLTRADVEWLLAAHEDGRGPVDWDDVAQRTRTGLDLRGADLRGVNLRRLPLARLIGGLAAATDAQGEQAAVRLEGADLRMAHLEGAELRRAHLEGAQFGQAHLEQAVLARAYLQRANCREAHFSGASLRNAHMERTVLYGAFFEAAELSGARLQAATLNFAHLEGASLGGTRLESAFLRGAWLRGAKLYGARLENAALGEAHLEGAVLRRAHLEGVALAGAHLEGCQLAAEDLIRIRRWDADFCETLPPADLRLVFFDAGTVLQDALLGDDRYGYVWLADVRWGDVNLAVLPWTRGHGHGRTSIVLGDEREARGGQRLGPRTRLCPASSGSKRWSRRCGRTASSRSRCKGRDSTRRPRLSPIARRCCSVSSYGASAAMADGASRSSSMRSPATATVQDVAWWRTCSRSRSSRARTTSSGRRPVHTSRQMARWSSA